MPISKLTLSAKFRHLYTAELPIIHPASWLVVLLLVVGYPFEGWAQTTKQPPFPKCGTVGLSPSQRQAIEQRMDIALSIKLKSGMSTSGITYVPIRPHIIRRSNGTGGFTLPALNRVLATVNRYYLLNGSGIQFYFAGTTPDYIDDDTAFEGMVDESFVDGHDAPNALNQYYVNAFSQQGLGGFAYYPDTTIQSTRSFILTGNGETEDDLGNRLIPHELGHTFNLVHTFGDSNSGPTTELVTRGAGANCPTTGDYLCDTPADPYYMTNATTTYNSGCQVYNGTATDPTGALYTPSTTNIMSYYFPCTHDFTPGQYNRIQGGLALRQSYTTYTINYPPAKVSAPSKLTATFGLRGEVNLKWQDNTANEMGYFIERATTLNGSFLALGGVGPNTTTFSDLTVESNTTYYYRIRPSNTTTGSLSPTLAVVTRTLTCIPTYTAGACTGNDGIATVVLNGDTLSYNTGCSGSKGYSEYTRTDKKIRSGQLIPFTVSFLSPIYEEGLAIWADLNRDGVYDTNENLFQASAVATGEVSGSLVIPSSVLAGPLAIRFVVAYKQVPTLPCDTYGYGETEDYQLTVLPPAGTYTIKEGAWNDPSTWQCNCIPTAADSVYLKHAITLPAGYIAHALNLNESSNLSFGPGARLQLGF